jgi:hypothetical protein
MTRIKVLGVALVAVFAMGALASSAMALPVIELEAGHNNAILMGNQAEGTHDTLNIEGSNVTCNTAVYNQNTPTANGATNGVLHPEYSNCTAFGFIGATINTSNCNYRGMASGTQDAEMFYNSGEIEIICNTGTGININGGGCSVTITPQTISSGIKFSNMTPVNPTNEKMDFTIHFINAPVTGIHVNSSNFPCNLKVGLNKNGTLNGTTTVRCTDPALTFVGCTING